MSKEYSHLSEITVLRTLAEIARYMRVNEKTIRRWIKRHGFPCVKLPSGVTVTSYFLIDTWLMARKRALDVRLKSPQS